MKNSTLGGRWLLGLLLLGFAGAGSSDADLVFFTVDKSVTLTFDAIQSVGCLATAGDAYIRTGVITNKSTNGTNWHYLVGNSFSAPVPAEKMNNLGNHKYSITITPYSLLPRPGRLGRGGEKAGDGIPGGEQLAREQGTRQQRHPAYRARG